MVGTREAVPGVGSIGHCLVDGQQRCHYEVLVRPCLARPVDVDDEEGLFVAGV